MSNQTRREFLKHTGTGMIGWGTGVSALFELVSRGEAAPAAVEMMARPLFPSTAGRETPQEEPNGTLSWPQSLH